MDDTKRCSRCTFTKPVSEFHKNANKRGGLRAYCKSCWSDYCKERWAVDRENPDRLRVRRAGHLRTKYGISIEDYERLLERQGGACAICGNGPEACSGNVGRLGPMLHVDHDHSCCPGAKTCGKCIRGIVCGTCNRALAFVELVGVVSVANYLKVSTS